MTPPPDTISAADAADDGSTTGDKLIFAPKDGQYTLSTLRRTDLSANPITQFETWYKHAETHGVFQPETTVLSTCHLPSGRVSARTVYLKQLDTRGFVVFTNLGTSRKAADLATNPNAALTFYWAPLQRQVRVEGPVVFLAKDENQTYFDTRERGSRVGAWASEQSCGIRDRQELEERVRDQTKRWEGEERVPVPPFWGGIRVVPLRIEFWQGRVSRLHDRFVYERSAVEEEAWTVERLSP